MTARRPRWKMIGYWRPPRDYPSPRWLVRPSWEAADRERIVGYLRAGRVARAWLGYSACRFGCGVDPRLMGSRDLTDGIWVWPEGLSHYVEAHGVALPDAIVEGMRVNDWRVPDVPTGSIDPTAEYDPEPWADWAFRFRPWYVLW